MSKPNTSPRYFVAEQTDRGWRIRHVCGGDLDVARLKLEKLSSTCNAAIFKLAVGQKPEVVDIRGPFQMWDTVDDITKTIVLDGSVERT
jgi:hypothetical protein